MSDKLPCFHVYRSPVRVGWVILGLDVPNEAPIMLGLIHHTQELVNEEATDDDVESIDPYLNLTGLNGTAASFDIPVGLCARVLVRLFEGAGIEFPPFTLCVDEAALADSAIMAAHHQRLGKRFAETQAQTPHASRTSVGEEDNELAELDRELDRLCPGWSE